MTNGMQRNCYYYYYWSFFFDMVSAVRICMDVVPLGSGLCRRNFAYFIFIVIIVFYPSICR